MPGPRAPKTIPRLGPVHLDKQPFRVGRGSRGVPRRQPADPSQQHQQQEQQRQRQRYRSPSAGFAPLLDGDNDTVMSDPVGGVADNDNNNDWEDVNDDDEEEDEGALDQDALLRSRLQALMIDSRDYDDILPAGFNEEQLRLDLEYAEREFDRQTLEPETVAFDEDFVDEDVYNELYIGDWMDEQEPVQLAEPIEGITDKSTLIHHHCNQQLELPNFHFLLGIHAHLKHMTQAEYRIWFEMLGTLRGEDGKPVPAIQQLPRQLKTLKGHVESRMPLLDMREANIPLQVRKMKTESASRKRQQQQQQQHQHQEQQQNGSDDEEDPSTIMAPLFFMDPHALFQAFLNSDTAADMHKGMAHFVDNPTELHHSLCWSSSVRTTSGEYAHFIGDNRTVLSSEDTGKAIFPSDFIYFRCLDDIDDVDCPCRLPEDHSDHMLHIGRVKAVGKNHTSDYTEYPGEITLIINECFSIDEIEDEFPGVGFGAQVHDGMKFRKNELVIRLEQEHWIPQQLADRFVPVQTDYFDGNNLDDPSPPVERKSSKKVRQLFDKYTTVPDNPKKKGHYLVRRALQRVYGTQDVGYGDHGRRITPLALTAPPRAELELKTYGREIFENQWDKVHGGIEVLSCPVLTFIDGFGVYRNARRSVMGVYQSPAGLSYGNGRARNANIFPVVLGPHASNFDAVVNAIGCLMPLDEGVMMDIKGKPTMVSVFTMCYTGDMPQQDKNSGTAGPAGLKFCRFCFIGPDHVVNKQEVVKGCDNIEMYRFHHQHLQMRHEVDVNIWRKGDKKAYRTQWGISEKRPALFDLTPALDTIMTRPPDPAHSEFKGMVAHIHEMLLDAFLTPRSRLEYGRALRAWPFPPGWTALPSPISYLKGYTLTEHGRWSVIAPPFLEAWLEKDHIDRHVWEAWKNIMSERIDDPSDDYLVRAISHGLAMMARSNSILMNTRNTQSEYDKLDTHIWNGRLWYKLMCNAAAEGIAKNPKAKDAFKGRARASELPSQMATSGSDSGLDDASIVEGVEDEDAPIAEAAAEAAAETRDRPLPKRAKDYIRKPLRPNVHVAVHYADIYAEYGPPGLLNVLAEEKYHKRLKKTAETTNGRDVERWILQHERIVHTIRFVLLNAFALSDPKLTQQIKDVAGQAPSLFESLINREDKIRLGLMELELEDELDVDLSADAIHLRPSAIGKFKPAMMRTICHPISAGINQDTGQPYPLPQTSKSMPDVFRRALSEAYDKDYGIPYIKRFGPGIVQYTKRVSFSDETFKRYTFNIGDHIRYRHEPDFGRIDHIFVHDQKNKTERRIFLVLTKMRVNGHLQSLDVPAVQDTNEAIIVGLPAVQTDRIYIVDISKLSERRQRNHQAIWAWINWDIILM